MLGLLLHAAMRQFYTERRQRLKRRNTGMSRVPSCAENFENRNVKIYIIETSTYFQVIRPCFQAFCNNVPVVGIVEKITQILLLL